MLTLGKSNILPNILSLIFCGIMSACSNVEDPNSADDAMDGYVQLNLVPGIGKVEISTRATPQLIDKAFANGGTYSFGFWICDGSQSSVDKDFTPHSPGMYNFESIFSPRINLSMYDSWQFKFDNFTHKHLGFRRGSEISIFANFPYVAGTHDPEHVPFSAGTYDVLWCDPLILTKSDLTGENINRQLKCHHLFTCIEIDMTLNHSGSIVLSSATLTDKEKKLVLSGFYNSITGEIQETAEYKESLTIDKINLTIYHSNPEKIYIMLPPFKDYYDGRFTLDFVLDGTKKSFTVPSIQGTTEFKASTKYIYKLNIENVMTFTASGIDENWVTEPIINIEL